MARGDATSVDGGVAADAAAAAPSSLALAWQLLLRGWSQHDAQLRALIATAQQTADAASDQVGEVLPRLLPRALPEGLHQAPPRAMARALRPHIEAALADSVHRHAPTLAEILSPLLLPVIRHAIGDYCRQAVQTFDRVLDQALSVQGLSWRWEAWRTGRSFGEVVLLHSLIYRVEDLLLIHKSSGLLLARASAQAAANGGEIAGMLTAIRDFVRDSFAASAAGLPDGAQAGATAAEGSGLPLVANDASFALSAMQVGDVSVWIEDLRDAYLAAVIRGNAPSDYRRTLQLLGRTMTSTFGRALANYDGDASSLQAASEVLEDGLLASYHQRPASGAAHRWQPWLRRSWLVVAMLVMALLGSVSWRRHGAQQAEQAARERYLGALAAVPGIVVIATQARAGELHIRALRDSLAVLPPLVPPPGTQVEWSDYVSTDGPIVARRARRILAAPPSVTVQLTASPAGGVLALRGVAPQRWLQNARQMAPLIPGVASVDSSQLVSSDQYEFAAAIARLSAMTLPLDAQGLPVAAAPPAWLATFVDTTLQLDRHARALNLPFYIVFEAGANPALAPAVRQRVRQLVGQLGWRLQTAGITTYGLLRIAVVGPPFADRLVHLRVAPHGVAFAPR